MLNPSKTPAQIHSAILTNTLKCMFGEIHKAFRIFPGDDL